jgi:hypothetical protein
MKNGGPMFQFFALNYESDMPPTDPKRKAETNLRNAMPPSFRNSVHAAPYLNQMKGMARGRVSGPRDEAAVDSLSHCSPVLINWDLTYGGLYRYELLAVIYHSGNRADDGHYFCRYRCGNDVYHYDSLYNPTDRLIGVATSIDDQERLIPYRLLSSEMNKATLLLYQRVN